MRILIADALPEGLLDHLRSQGMDLVVDATLKEDRLLEAIVGSEAAALVVRSTRVNAAMLSSGQLKLVVRAGAGVNTIDLAAASKHGVAVANCPGKNSLAVAELAIGLLICLDRRIPDAVSELRDGRWNKKEFSKSRGLAGRTMGIVGGGRIGLAVAERALALGMEVLVWNIPGEGAEERAAALGAKFEGDLHTMLARCNAVSLHLAENQHTRGIAGRSFFEALPDGATFLNTSRAGLVDEEALRWALDAKTLRAGLDVFAGEVSGGTGEVTTDLLKHPGVWATPHIGASTEQAQEAVAAEAARILLAFSTDGTVPNLVNQPAPG